MEFVQKSQLLTLMTHARACRVLSDVFVFFRDRVPTLHNRVQIGASVPLVSFM